MEPRPIHVVVNPASGRQDAILPILNAAFSEAGVRWSATVTTESGDARAQAAEAADRGCEVVAACGGDGTVSAVAAGLMGKDCSLAILPAGTGNAVAQELGVPLDLHEAALLAASPDARAEEVDLLRIGERVGLLRVGVGADAGAITGATQELKSRLGWLAYPLAALRELNDPTLARLRLTLDDRVVEQDGYAVVVANVGRMGRGGARFPGEVSPFDGLSDVYLLRSADVPDLIEVAARLLRWPPSEESGSVTGADEPLWHLRARHIRIESLDAPLPYHVDGDPRGETPVEVETCPRAVRVLLPALTAGS